MQIRAMDHYLAGPARAAGRDDSTRRDLPQGVRGLGNQDIHWIVARQGRGQLEIRRQFGRQILQRVNRDIDLSAQQSLFEFLGEQSLVNFRLPGWLRLISSRRSPVVRDDPDDYFRSLRESLKRLFDELSLSQCQPAAASPKNYRLHVCGRSIAAGAIVLSAIRFNQTSKSRTCFSIKPSQASISFLRVSSVRSAMAWSESKS